MPSRPSRPCRQPGCPGLQPCALHPLPKPFESSRPRHPLGYASSGYERQRIAAQVLERDGHRCQLMLLGCTNVGTTPDHIVSPRDGGLFTLSNLRASCKSCNEVRRREQSRDGRMKVR